MNIANATIDEPAKIKRKAKQQVIEMKVKQSAHVPYRASSYFPDLPRAIDYILLLPAGLSPEQIEKRFRMNQRLNEYQFKQR